MAPVTRELSATTGVLEPIQTARSVQGQVDELAAALDAQGTPPVTLIGHSWGAWLSGLVAAARPRLVRKLVLVGAAPFETSYVPEITETRESRLAEPEREELRAATNVLAGDADGDEDAAMATLESLLRTTDAYDPVPEYAAAVDHRPEVHRRVWARAAEMRASGELLAAFEEIRCPVVAIHGEFDSHPAEGVRKPLEGVLDEFRFVTLQRCGHEPWIERHARDRFFDVLRAELDADV